MARKYLNQISKVEDIDGQLYLTLTFTGVDLMNNHKFYVNGSLVNHQVTSSSSIGYAYSKEDKNTYYYTEYNNQYTVISDTKKIMSKEEFEENYYVVTTKYDNSNILDDAIDYDLDDDLDIEELENNKITKKSLLKSNIATKSSIKLLYF